MRTVNITTLLFFVLYPAICLGQVAETGSVYAWGLNDEGQCNVPEPNTGFIDIAGAYHSLGLKADGSIVAWGRNNDGQCDVPAPNTGFIDIAAGWWHSLGLKEADGSIVAWGRNEYGQCDVPPPNTGFIDVAAGAYHSLGLKADGSIVAWGRNNYGQCDVPAPNTGFIAIVTGGNHSLGLKEADGSIVAWGRNDYGQCDVPAPNTGFIAIAAGGVHSLGLKEADGSIVAWGSNSYGQRYVPPPNTGFSTIAAGRGHSLGLKDVGSIVAWGGNSRGQRDVPLPNTDFIAIAAGWEHSLAIKTPPSAFAYQGILVDESIPMDGFYDFEFKLYDGPSEGNQLARTVISDDLNVIDGHYNTELDFGRGVFNGEHRWLEIWTRLGDSTGEFITLGPRQKISPVPYALYAQTSGSVAGGGIGGGSRNSLDAADGSPTDAVYVDNAGNVGIGTTSPTKKLEVRGGPIKATSGLIIETRTSDPSNPVTGQMWLRTDL